ncbi:MAG: TolC family protein [Bacteroidales bacterium]|nr:TolC family protein [Bacteroidales bacterium]
MITVCCFVAEGQNVNISVPQDSTLAKRTVVRRINRKNDRWTLEQCIAYAIDNNISIKQIELQRARADIQFDTYRHSTHPNLSASGENTMSFQRVETGDDRPDNSSQWNSSFSIGSATPIFHGYKIKHEIEKGRIDLQVATENLNRAKDDMSLNITQMYLQALFYRETQKVYATQLQQSKSQADRTRALVEEGRLAETQLFDIEAEVARNNASLVEASNNVTLALLELRQAMELEEPLFDIVAPDSTAAIEKSIDELHSPQTVYDTALEIKPLIKSLQLQVESARTNMEITRAAMYPQLDFIAGYSTSYNHNFRLERLDSRYNSSFGNQLRDNGTTFLGVRIETPIYSRKVLRNQLSLAELEVSNLELELQNTKKTLFKEIQTAYTNAVVSQERYKALAQAVKAAEESVRHVQERYDAGKSTTYEFAEAQSRLTQSRLELVQAQFDFLFRTKILDFYYGRPIQL